MGMITFILHGDLSKKRFTEYSYSSINRDIWNISLECKRVVVISSYRGERFRLLRHKNTPYGGFTLELPVSDFFRWILLAIYYIYAGIFLIISSRVYVFDLVVYKVLLIRVFLYRESTVLLSRSEHEKYVRTLGVLPRIQIVVPSEYHRNILRADNIVSTVRIPDYTNYLHCSNGDYDYDLMFPTRPLESKGFDLFLDALTKVEGSFNVLVPLSGFEAVRRKVLPSEIQVEFYDTMCTHTMMNYMTKSRIIVCPSFNEGFAKYGTRYLDRFSSNFWKT